MRFHDAKHALTFYKEGAGEIEPPSILESDNLKSFLLPVGNRKGREAIFRRLGNVETWLSRLAWLTGNDRVFQASDRIDTQDAAETFFDLHRMIGALDKFDRKVLMTWVDEGKEAALKIIQSEHPRARSKGRIGNSRADEIFVKTKKAFEWALHGDDYLEDSREYALRKLNELGEDPEIRTGIDKSALNLPRRLDKAMLLAVSRQAAENFRLWLGRLNRAAFFDTDGRLGACEICSDCNGTGWGLTSNGTLTGIACTRCDGTGSIQGEARAEKNNPRIEKTLVS
ncbi:hypothetical protein SBDP1_340009 [Syntrophobacter sp. SbD1]|nr:hypothetical protein SBDP1_340009 [Syntrophobacter sp. SbD1]